MRRETFKEYRGKVGKRERRKNVGEGRNGRKNYREGRNLRNIRRKGEGGKLREKVREGDIERGGRIMDRKGGKGERREKKGEIEVLKGGEKWKWRNEGKIESRKEEK